MGLRDFQLAACVLALVTTSLFVDVSPAHAGGKTVVLRPVASGEARARHVKRALASLQKQARGGSIKLASRRHTPSASCAAKPACLARKGRKLRAGRVVGIVVHRRRGRFTVTYRVVDVKTKRELAVRVFKTPDRDALKAEAGKELAAALEAAATSPDEKPAEKPLDKKPAEKPLDKKPAEKPLDKKPAEKPPDKEPAEPVSDEPAGPQLVVSFPATVRGDGRTLFPVELTGSPAPQQGELAKHPEVPALDCDHAVTVPGGGTRPVAVIAPALRVAREVQCTVTHRGATGTFSFRAQPPDKPGLYVELDKAVHKATDELVELNAFVVDKRGAIKAPGALRAAVSAGAVTVGKGGTLRVKPPDSRAPRVISLAVTDGTRVGAAFIPLWGVTKLDVEAERRSRVSMRIAGRWTGTKLARRGHVKLNIEVPPGVGFGVVRALKRGAAVESYASLKLPRLPRIAALAVRETVPAGGTVQLLIAVSATDGRPADDDTRFVMRTKLGTLGEPEPLGRGLWTVAYTAKGKPTDDRVVVRLARARKAGRVKVPVTVVAGAAKAILLDVPKRDHSPGGPFEARVVMRDAQGNLLTKTRATAKVGGEPLVIEPAEGGFALRGTLPTRIPSTGHVEVVIDAGGVTERRSVRVHPDPPVSAGVKARRGSRVARLEIEVRDRHGNLVPREAFKLAVKGSAPVGLSRERDHYEGRLHATRWARAGSVEVRVGDRVLARKSVVFDPPNEAFLLGGYGEGGWVTTGGDFAAPRFGAGLGLRRFLGPIEVAVTLGAEAFQFSDTQEAMIGGAPRMIARSITGIGLPVWVRGRLPLSMQLGVSLGAAFVPTRVDSTLGANFQPDDHYSDLVLGTRSRVSVDWRWRQVRVRVSAEYGIANLLNQPLTGRVDGLGLTGGLEWWFADLGP